MKHVKYFLLWSALIMMSCTSFAQKQTFDVVSFAFPKGWQQQKSEAGIQLSITDKKTGIYGIAVITKARASSAAANENFNNDWDKLVKKAITVATAPSISDMNIETGWSCITGQANYKDGATKGIATLITATGYGQTVSIVIMTNTSKYQEEILAFVNSLELPKANQIKIGNTAIGGTNDAGKSSVVGLWCDNHLETSGYFNGLPQYSAGYFRREYLFKADGTYIFRLKNWSSLLKEILFAYETGTYSVQGNQLIVTPKQGRGEWWTKVGQQASAWGKRIKASDYKLEKTTYTFEIKYYSGSGGYSLIINANKNTERDGTLGRDGFSYSKFETGKSIIDNPPGFKTGVADKSFTSSSTSSQQNTNNAMTGTWLKSGSVRIGSGIEKQWGVGTGGYMTDEYIFDSNGSYQFYSKLFSMTIDKLVLIRESGNYKIENNILTILPVKSTVESYTKKDGVDKWGKLLAKENRPLEKTTYTFTKHFFEGIKEWNLVLQAKMPTNRDGPFSNNTTFTNAYYYTVPSNIHTNIDLP